MNVTIIYKNSIYEAIAIDYRHVGNELHVSLYGNLPLEPGNVVTLAIESPQIRFTGIVNRIDGTSEYCYITLVNVVME